MIYLSTLPTYDIMLCVGLILYKIGYKGSKDEENSNSNDDVYGINGMWNK